MFKMLLLSQFEVMNEKLWQKKSGIKFSTPILPWAT
jgi:hypothetical protein